MRAGAKLEVGSRAASRADEGDGGEFGPTACLTSASVSRRPHCQMFQRRLPKHHGTRCRGCSTICRGCSWACTMRGAGGRGRGAAQLYGRRSLLSQTFAIGALMLPEVAWGQVTETLPEVTVWGPRPAPIRLAHPTEIRA